MKSYKGLIVYHLDVRNLPIAKAEALVKKLRDEIVEKRDEHWPITVAPNRHEGNKVEVFSFEGEQPEVIPPVRINSKELIVVEGEMPKSQIREYVFLMLGAPVYRISDEICDLIDELIEDSFAYEINKKQDFVYDYVNDLVQVVDNTVVRKK
jgi:hypothetical protein